MKFVYAHGLPFVLFSAAISAAMSACAETPAPVRERVEPTSTSAAVVAASASPSASAAPPASAAALPEDPCAGKNLDLAIVLANKACKVDAPITKRFEPSELAIGLRTLTPPGKGGDIVDFEVTLENKTSAPLAMTFRCAPEPMGNSIWGDDATGAFGALGRIGKSPDTKPSKKEKTKTNKPRAARPLAVPAEPPGTAPGFLVTAEDDTGRPVTGAGILGLLAPPSCKVEIAQGGRAHALVRWKAMGIPKSEEATAYEPLPAGVYKVHVLPPWVGATDTQGNPPSASVSVTILK